MNERGAALVEFALLAPLLILLCLGTVDVGQWILAKYELEQAAEICSEVGAEDLCGMHAESIGAVLECYQVTPAGEPCFDDGLGSTPRVTVLLSRDSDGILLSTIRLRSRATGLSGS